MRSVVVRQHGGAEVLILQPGDVPAPGPGQIQVRQRAIGLNMVDVYHRKGLYPTPLPFTPGTEAAGEVAAVGRNVTEFRIGDRVAYGNVFGAYAESRNIDADQVVKIPAGMDLTVAAALMVKGLTAHFLLHRTHNLRPGESIVIHAAAGGVGLLLAQWARAKGAIVIGCVGSRAKAQIAHESGCSHVIVMDERDFVEDVRRLTGGAGADVVYDSLGQETFLRSLDCLRPEGLLVSFGNATGPVSVPNLGVLAQKGSLFVVRPTMGTYNSTAAEMRSNAAALFAAVEDGTLKVRVGQTFPLEDVADAHRAIEQRRTTGSTVILA